MTAGPRLDLDGGRDEDGGAVHRGQSGNGAASAGRYRNGGSPARPGSAARADAPRRNGAVASSRARSGATGPRRPGRGGGPYDEDDLDPDRPDGVDRTDFGSLRLPVPAGGLVDVEPSTKGKLQAVHITLAEGRLSVSALAAPTTGRLWPELAKEINTSLRKGGARVRSVQGRWGRELRARTGEAFSVFVGIDGPRWMVYGVATGPAEHARMLDRELRRILGETVVVRGQAPYPVRTVLPLQLPEDLQAERDARLERERAAAAALEAQEAERAAAAAAEEAEAERRAQEEAARRAQEEAATVLPTGGPPAAGWDPPPTHRAGAAGAPRPPVDRPLAPPPVDRPPARPPVDLDRPLAPPPVDRPPAPPPVDRPPAPPPVDRPPARRPAEVAATAFLPRVPGRPTDDAPTDEIPRTPIALPATHRNDSGSDREPPAGSRRYSARRYEAEPDRDGPPGTAALFVDGPAAGRHASPEPSGRLVSPSAMADGRGAVNGHGFHAGPADHDPPPAAGPQLPTGPDEPATVPIPVANPPAPQTDDAGLRPAAPPAGRHAAPALATLTTDPMALFFASPPGRHRRGN